MNYVKIAPSILSGDFANMGNTVKSVNEWGADYVHVDVMDGVFVKNLTFGMPMIKAIKPYSLIPLDVHLMITEPEKYIEEFAYAGADIITFHPNSTLKTSENIELIHSLGKKAGLAINPDIPVSLIAPYINNVDMITLMGVYAGFGGQKYIKDVDAKIIETAELICRAGKSIELELDGGVTEEIASDLIRLGVNVLVGGSAVFKSKNPAKTINLLRGDNQ